MNSNASNLLQDLLDERGVLLADGATGTTLFSLGLMSGDAPELWNSDQPDKIRQLHRSFVDAGSDIVLTNSFGGTAHRLKLHNAQHRVRELNKNAAELAREVADASGRKILVAGSVGPTGELFEPLGALTPDEALNAFAEQIDGLKAGGADVAWIETMSAPEEIRAASAAAIQVGLPYAFTGSFDTAGKTMMGLDPAAIHEICSELSTPPIAYGANCGVGAPDILVALLKMQCSHNDIPLIVKGNCGIPQFRGTEIHYSGTPELMAQYARLAIDAGARIVGGCCGTTAIHIAAMRDALDTHEKQEAPNYAKINEQVGSFVNAISSPMKSMKPLHARRRKKRRIRP